ADEAGVPALRHDRQLRLGAEPYDRRHLVGGGRLHHGRGVAPEKAAPLDEMRLHRFGRVEEALRADRLANFLEDAHSTSLGAAARRSRSLIARPSPSSGIGITAIPAYSGRSSARKAAKRLAAASIRSPERLSQR